MREKLKKISMIVCLVLVLILIYMMQSSVLYAEENSVQNVENESKEDCVDDSADELEKDSEDVPKEETDAEPELAVEKYKLTISDVDGKNGYYISKPKIKIEHVSEAGVTKYQLFHQKELMKEEILSEKDLAVTISEKSFEEGQNLLKIWMEDEEGIVVEGTEFQKEILIDTTAPEVKMELPNGFQVWYKGQTTLSIKSTDEVSKVESISCISGGKKVGEVQSTQASFPMQMASNIGQGVEVLVTVRDYAGNVSEKRTTVFVDNSAPKVLIKGAEDFLITSEPVTLSYLAEEDNILENVSADVKWENTSGEKKDLKVESWNRENFTAQADQILTQDGIYEIYFMASDRAGYTTEKKMQVIIDQKNPVIKFVDKLDQQYLQYFLWDYGKEEIVEDFTTYMYEIRLDGRLYHLGEKVQKEGRHILEIKAKDAAGNEAKAQAEFFVDHTKPEILFINVEDGETYEKEKTFKIALKDQRDLIEQISINGELQEITQKAKAYQYTVNKEQDYNVIVTAKDKAGNYNQKSLFFTLEPEKTVFEKITEPLKKKFSSMTEQTESGDKKVVKKEKNLSKSIQLIKGIGVVATGAWFTGCFWKKRKNKNS